MKKTSNFLDTFFYVVLMSWLVLATFTFVSCEDSVCKEELGHFKNLADTLNTTIIDLRTQVQEVTIRNLFLDSVIIAVDGGLDLLNAIDGQLTSQVSQINELSKDLTFTKAELESCWEQLKPK